MSRSSKKGQSCGNETPRVGVMCLTADPIHYGHRDVVERAIACGFDKIVIGIAEDTAKNTLFSPEERLELAQEALSDLGPRVHVEKYSGASVDFVVKHGSRTILRGQRSGADFEYEEQVCTANRLLSKERFGFEVDTIFFLSASSVSHISSTLIRNFAEIHCTEEELSTFCMPHVARALVEKKRERSA